MMTRGTRRSTVVQPAKRATKRSRAPKSTGSSAPKRARTAVPSLASNTGMSHPSEMVRQPVTEPLPNASSQPEHPVGSMDNLAGLISSAVVQGLQQAGFMPNSETTPIPAAPVQAPVAAVIHDLTGTSDEAGGFPNVEFSPGNSVEGCVYCLTETELTMLDNCMGYPKHYTRVVVPVWMLNCSDPSRHGVAQYCVPAVLYVAQDNWVSQDFQPQLNCSYCVNQCLKACDILTPNYVQFLSSQAAN